MTKIYYKVLFNDGDIDIELQDEDYDSTDLEQVRKHAKSFKDARIVKVIEEEIE